MKEPTGWVESSLKLSIVERRIEKCQLQQFPDWISHPTDTTLYDATRRQLTADIFIIEIPPLLLLLVIIIEWVITGIKINPCCEFAVTGHNTFWLIGGGGGGTAEWKPFPGLTDMADASFLFCLQLFLLLVLYLILDHILLCCCCCYCCYCYAIVKREKSSQTDEILSSFRLVNCYSISLPPPSSTLLLSTSMLFFFNFLF